MTSLPLDDGDRALVAAARDTLAKTYRPERHTVAAAVRCGSGRVYTGIDIESCGYGPCAEPIALGAAFTNRERDVLEIVAVGKEGDTFPVLSPCGNCRQMLVDYAPEAFVIFVDGGQVVKARAADLLPGAFHADLD